MSSDIPTIDFGRFERSEKDGTQLASEIDAALSTVGFLHLVNHGIEQGKIDESFQWVRAKSRKFFSLSPTDKESMYPRSEAYDCGYVSLGQEKVRGKNCMKECVDINGSSGGEMDRILPGFHGFMVQFHQECAILIQKLLKCLSVALGLGDEDALGQHHTDSLFNLNLIHYPEVAAEQLRSGSAVRLPAHSDPGSLTLLFQQKVGGLEIADMSSTCETATVKVEQTAKFIAVEPQPATILVNVGYLLMRWSNGRWKNTVHRVMAPPVSGNTDSVDTVPERYSTAFFSFPGPDTVIEPLDACISVENPRRWAPIIAGKYLRKKISSMYS
ncbi:Clavaminate synthase-like protein [Zopfia rhizophila CBS 207.26]|uniref:Clavaminate synthase-like protein n=1 Tax=Zopfia rhizophila CBS 207.26 TaxID=1314779 RepID=A0A6A6EV99_9PEZI|nr:Clavaminate synthase-like protein [Zopfia rhizophila CBS 207.26]